MSAYKRLYKSDIVNTPYLANKNWSISVCDLESYGIRVYNGVKTSSIFDYDNDIKTNNEYDRLVFESVNHLYYQSFSGSYLDDSSNLASLNYASASIYRPSGAYYDYTPQGYMVKDFPTGSDATIKVLSVSKDVYGTSLKKMSFNISTSFMNLQDDGKGNIYDTLATGSKQSANVEYATDGVRLYSSGYDTYISWNTIAGGGAYTGTFWTNPIAANKTGRLNYAGMWSANSLTYLGAGTLTFNITAASDTTYYFGIGCDNLASVYLDDNLIITQPSVDNTGANFKYWHIYPVNVTAGSHTVKLVGENTGVPSPSNPASMGIEIYNNTEAQISASIASTPNGSSIPSGINVVYSSKDHLTEGSFSNTTDDVIGNIFYEHGLVILTHPDYQEIFPLPPYAKDDSITFSSSTSPKLISPLTNDNSRGWNTLTGSIELSGSDAAYFTNNGNGTLTLSASVIGTYTTYYRFSTSSPSSNCSLKSNYAKIEAKVQKPLCKFVVYARRLNPELTVFKNIASTPVNNGNGTYTVTYNISVENTGDEDITNILLTDALDITFSDAVIYQVDSLTSSVFNINSYFDGGEDQQLITYPGADLLVGESGTIVMTVTYTPAVGPYSYDNNIGYSYYAINEEYYEEGTSNTVTITGTATPTATPTPTATSTPTPTGTLTPTATPVPPTATPTPTPVPPTSTPTPTPIPPTSTPTPTPAYSSFLLAYSSLSGLEACGRYPTLFTNTYYAAPGITVLSNGVTMYQDSALTSPVGNGFYSNGVNYWNTGAGAGNLQNQTSCGTSTPTPTPTNTPTPTPTATSYDVYLADQYQCSDCTVSVSSMLVAFPTGQSVTIGNWYPDGSDTDHTYKILSTSTGAGYILTNTYGSFTSCALACAI